jgi:hypothetical protein
MIKYACKSRCLILKSDILHLLLSTCTSQTYSISYIIYLADLTTLYMIELFLSDQWHGQMSSQEESLIENDAR